MGWFQPRFHIGETFFRFAYEYRHFCFAFGYEIIGSSINLFSQFVFLRSHCRLGKLKYVEQTFVNLVKSWISFFDMSFLSTLPKQLTGHENENIRLIK